MMGTSFDNKSSTPEIHAMPFVVIRAMSDKADGNAHESVDNMGDLAADNSSRIVIQMMDAMRS